MSKGLFTQGVCLLTDGTSMLSTMKDQLNRHGFAVIKEVAAGDVWQFGGESLVVSYRPDINGYVSIDFVNHVWPDAMGDPQTDTTTFGAWSMGHFGPSTYPMALRRAGQHAWSWDQAHEVAAAHKGFIRIRLSYAFGAKASAPVFPSGINSIDELKFINRIVLVLFEAPGVLCYFNPNGEVLCDKSRYSREVHECEEGNFLTLSLWSNVRFFNLSETLLFMDTIGNQQLDVMDIEAIFLSKDYEPAQVDYYLRNVTQYLIDARPNFKSGEKIDGPNETNLSWTLEVIESKLVAIPREVLRLYPTKDGDEVRRTLGVDADRE